jgi:hypothetical protein
MIRSEGDRRWPMGEIRIDAADELLRQLRLRAESKGKPVEEIILEALRRGMAADPVTGLPPGAEPDARRLAELAEAKLGTALARLTWQVSAERRRELAKRAATGKPLSEIITEDRGE